MVIRHEMTEELKMAALSEADVSFAFLTRRGQIACRRHDYPAPRCHRLHRMAIRWKDSAKAE
jgi:hypothetical protein